MKKSVKRWTALLLMASLLLGTAFAMVNPQVLFAEELNAEETVAESEADNIENENAEAEPETSNEIAFVRSEIVDGVEVSVEAEEGVLPEDALLSVRKCDTSEKESVEEAIGEEREISDHVVASYTFDIKIVDEEGEEVEPNGDVKVSFEAEEAENTNLQADVYHVSETDEASLDAEKLDTEVDGTTVSVISDGFSYYMVEFTYGRLQYVMQGDSEIPLADILDAVGLSGTVTEAESSNAELFAAEKADDEWMVVAKQAFDTEEWLKVTIDGVVYEIVVTDSNPTTEDYIIKQYDAQKWNNHYYRVFNKEYDTWEDAEKYCESIGGHLVVITTKEEADYINSIEKSSGNYYLGAKRMNGWFRWVTGEEWNFALWDQGYPYANYGEDDRLFLCTNPMSIFGPNRWRNYRNARRGYVICEWEPDLSKYDITDARVDVSRSFFRYDGNEKEPSVTVTRNVDKLILNEDYAVSYENNTKIGIAKIRIKGMGDYSGETDRKFEILQSEDFLKREYNASQYNGHYYKVFETTYETWDSAENYCESLGGHLVTITSEEELNFIALLPLVNGSYADGGYRKNGQLCWVTGEPWDYGHWDNVEPDGNGNYIYFSPKGWLGRTNIIFDDVNEKKVESFVNGNLNMFSLVKRIKMMGKK